MISLARPDDRSPWDAHGAFVRSHEIWSDSGLLSVEPDRARAAVNRLVASPGLIEFPLERRLDDIIDICLVLQLAMHMMR